LAVVDGQKAREERGLAPQARNGPSRQKGMTREEDQAVGQKRVVTENLGAPFRIRPKSRFHSRLTTKDIRERFAGKTGGRKR
jgi:hypothetical protein